MPIHSLSRHGVAILLASTSLFCVLAPSAADAQARTASPDGSPALSAPPASDQTPGEVVVTARRSARSSVQLSGVEIQKILPGVSAFRAINTLPGVNFETADPWGNNEQNIALYVHGFALNQLGYTLDGIPLGDQENANWNSIAPARAITSENVSSIDLSSGAADLGIASTSNLGGAIEISSRDPAHKFGGSIQETVGSYRTLRNFIRLDTGDFGDGNSAYISYLHHDARAWDFDGHQKFDQLNAKFVHETDAGKFTAYFDYSEKLEPNEDPVVHNGTAAAPYTRPTLYPDLGGALAYLNPVTGAPPAADGNNFHDYYSVSRRRDYLGYVKYDWKISSNLHWSNQAYYHQDIGTGNVATPVNQSGLPALLTAYFPGQSLSQVIQGLGGTGYVVRSSTYAIHREGLISRLQWTPARHEFEVGGWYEHLDTDQGRVWYPFSEGSTDLSPYQIPTNPSFTQYHASLHSNVVMLYARDVWHVTPNLTVQFGNKASLQFAHGGFPINQLNASTVKNPTIYPSGSVDTKKWLLPVFGAIWDAGRNDQIFANIQRNVRQFEVYGGGGVSPFSLGNQAAFDLFKGSVQPETSWTYEIGLRDHRQINFGPITAIEGQINYYHVDFSNRLLQISSTPVINSLVGGASILTNVGGVKTDGIDIGETMHFGRHFSFYDAFSYNHSTYNRNYTSGTTVIPTAGKIVPGPPSWMNKFIASTQWGKAEFRFLGDYVGKRYATYTDDLSVRSYFTFALAASYRFDLPPGSVAKALAVSLNITNLTNEKGVSTLKVGAASGTYNTYPLPPRMAFVNLKADF